MDSITGGRFGKRVDFKQNRQLDERPAHKDKATLFETVHPIRRGELNDRDYKVKD